MICKDSAVGRCTTSLVENLSRCSGDGVMDEQVDGSCNVVPIFSSNSKGITKKTKYVCIVI